MGNHGRGRKSSHCATSAAACPQLRGTQRAQWKSSWQMLATALGRRGPCRGLGLEWWRRWDPHSVAQCVTSSRGSRTPSVSTLWFCSLGLETLPVLYVAGSTGQEVVGSRL